MMKILYFLIPLLLSSSVAQASESASEAISPVYEQMVGNKAALLYKDLAHKNKIRPEEPFYLIDWESGKLASKISSGWKVRSCPPCGTMQGFIFFDANTTGKHALKSAAGFLKQMSAGLLLIFHVDAGEAKVWNQAILDDGLRVVENIQEPELEFLKNSSGRQAVDLNDSKTAEPVYERLVRSGLNPVQAWPLAEEVIRRFRLSDERILITSSDKNS